MAFCRLVWLPPAKAKFDDVRQTAARLGREGRFIRLHNSITAALQDLSKAMANGEPIRIVKTPSGMVGVERLWLNGLISVVYLIFAEKRTALICSYYAEPENWPDDTEIA